MIHIYIALICIHKPLDILHSELQLHHTIIVEYDSHFSVFVPQHFYVEV